MHQLRGMFAFALWDARRQRLLLARDRVGIKPLYYRWVPGRSITFASEIKALLADPTLEPRVDLRVIDRFLAHYYVPGENAPLVGVRKLAPGHVLSVENGRIDTRRYWDLPTAAPRDWPSFEAAAQQVTELLADSVREHLASDVPVGVLLSGGVDSSAVLHYASRASAQPLHSFTVGFDGGDVPDERPYARLAAHDCGAQHHETSFGAADFQALLPRYVWHMEEPVCEPPAIALFVVAALARRCGVPVLLSGEGGDEAFGGYPEYRNLLALESLKRLAGPALTERSLHVLQRVGWTRAAHYAQLAPRALRDYYLSRTATPGTPFNRMRGALWRTDYAPDDRDATAPTRELFERLGVVDPLASMLYVDTHTWLPDDLLLKADRMTMAASVELRVPLLDHRLLELAFKLPAHYKVRGPQLKRVLRHALRGVVPRPILERPKAGFPVPYRRWLRHELRAFVFDTVLSSNSFAATYFARPVVERLLEMPDTGSDSAKEVFGLLALELWYQQFVRLPASDAAVNAGERAEVPLLA